MTCPACEEKRLHTPEEWKNHPFAGHGFTREHGWTHPELESAFNRAINNLGPLHNGIAAAVEKSKAIQAAPPNEAKQKGCS